MTTIVATVKGLKVFKNENSATVELMFDQKFDGYVKNKQTGAFEKAQVNTVSFYRSALTAQLCEFSDDIAFYYCCLEHPFEQKDLAKILFNAKLKLNLTEHSAGDVIEVNGEKRVLERDCIFTDIVDIVKLDDKAKARLDKFVNEL